MPGSRANSSRLPAAERRRQLLDVALEAFGSKGYHQTSMNEVAEAAGVTKPVLYQHFSSKRDLFLELLREVGSRLRDEVSKATVEADGPRQQVEAGFTAYFRWVADNQGGFDVLFAGETRRDKEFVREAMKVETQIADAIATLIVVPGLSADRQRLLAYGIVGMAETTCRHWLGADVELEPDALAEQVAELAWAGLRGLRPG
ncbi:MAG: TetR/AcrR family transcriptional regulator [Actinobacteria bacterium]|nr:TetR/AcrR family transcriptional regulator [Actinomycetota bacterium]